MKNRIIESTIIAVGLLLLGLSIKSGINAFSQRNRTVTVKGLAEKEIPADKVIWPSLIKKWAMICQLSTTTWRRKTGPLYRFSKAKA